MATKTRLVEEKIYQKEDARMSKQHLTTEINHDYKP